MHTVMITGANRGLGLEMVKQYAADGWKVLACCRSIAKAEALNKLASQNKQISVIELDVSDKKNIEAIKKQINVDTIDLLINNAGVYGGNQQKLGQADADVWLNTFKINTMAPLFLTEALLDKIAKSELKTVAHISSVMGSIAGNTSGGEYIYRSSKAALNAVTKSMAIDLADKKIKVVALHPGWVKTDMGGEHADITPEESIKGIRKVLSGLTLDASGCLIKYNGERLAW